MTAQEFLQAGATGLALVWPMFAIALKRALDLKFHLNRAQFRVDTAAKYGYH